MRRVGPHRLVAQDVALSRPKRGFETPWGHSEGREKTGLPPFGGPPLPDGGWRIGAGPMARGSKRTSRAKPSIRRWRIRRVSILRLRQPPQLNGDPLPMTLSQYVARIECWAVEAAWEVTGGHSGETSRSGSGTRVWTNAHDAARV
jgi:hypothetical protein